MGFGSASGLGRAIAVAAVGFLLASGSVVAAALPGGATTLNETHGEWTVNCRIATQAKGKPVACQVVQNLVDKAKKQHLLSIVLGATATAGVKGVLIMPFGLDLEKGVTFQIDDKSPSAAMRFHTCMPIGCLVKIDWSASSVTALRTAKSLKVAAVGQAGNAAQFAIPLDGFSSALDRAIALTK